MFQWKSAAVPAASPRDGCARGRCRLLLAIPHRYRHGLGCLANQLRFLNYLLIVHHLNGRGRHLPSQTVQCTGCLSTTYHHEEMTILRLPARPLQASQPSGQVQRLNRLCGCNRLLPCSATVTGLWFSSPACIRDTF